MEPCSGCLTMMADSDGLLGVAMRSAELGQRRLVSTSIVLLLLPVLRILLGSTNRRRR